MRDRVIVVGAGVGGLAAAMRLAHAGCDVTVVDGAAAAGGKMRTVDSAAGPVDAGPTVLTMRPVFEALFDACGTSLADHVTTERLEVLARHHWDDGASLDLFADRDRSADAVAAFAGTPAAAQFRAFDADAGRLFDAFEAPMMQAPAPTVAAMAGVVLRDPGLIRAMAPGRSLDASLARRFDDARLRQLFGRYATYVGGDPRRAPAILALIWQAERRGVWAVRGGMHRLARAMQAVAEAAGARFVWRAHATRLETQGGRIVAVHAGGTRHACDVCVFNGDPRALTLGLTAGAETAVRSRAVAQRSLSAFVWSFAATATGRVPAHHNVYFGHTPTAEFADIEAGRLPADPTLYVCAQDRGAGPLPYGAERFEIIINGPPRAGTTPDPEEAHRCRMTTFDRLAAMGLTFDPMPETDALTTPEGFAARFPGTDGSLYGLSPHGAMAAFRRPRARTDLPGLYLAGGGTHPGAGVPMAAMSGRHAAEAILTDLASTSPSRRTATAGGTSTASARTAGTPSR